MGFCEHGNGNTIFMILVEIFVNVNDYQFVKESSAPWNESGVKHFLSLGHTKLSDFLNVDKVASF